MWRAKCAHDKTPCRSELHHLRFLELLTDHILDEDQYNIPNSLHLTFIYLIEHPTAMNIPLMRTHLWDVCVEQLAGGEEEFAHRRLGNESLVAFDRRNVFARRAEDTFT